MTDVAVKMPQVPFGTHTISRLIVGGNQQIGVSHQTKEMGKHLLEYFTVDGTVAFLRDCLAQGINSWQANSSDKTRDVLAKLRDAGDDINVIPLTAPVMIEREGGWDKLLALKPIGIYLWGMVADRLYREGKLDTIRDFMSKVRDTGALVGIGTHIPEVIEYIEEKGWDIDFYMASVYKWGKTPEEILKIMPEVPHDGANGWELYLPSELPKMCDTISKTKKTCLAFKIFAGGRTCNTSEQVSEVFEFVFSHIKPEDPVVVGMYPRFADQITENADLAKKFGQVQH